MTVLSNWLLAFPSFVLIAIFFFAPGAILLWIARVRGAAVLLFAPLVSIFLSSWVPVALAVIGVRYTRISFSICVALIALILFAAVRLAGVRWPVSRPVTAPVWPIVLGVVLTAPITAAAMLKAISNPILPTQTWDGVFHINALRYIIETGNGSSFALGAISSETMTQRFYPGGWHDIVSLGFLGDPVVTTNAGSVFFASVVFPLAIATLVAVLVPHRKMVPIFGAFASLCFTSLPERPASYGTIWPVMASYVMVPLVLAALVSLVDRRNPHWHASLAVTVLGVSGLGLVHPSAVFVAGVLGWWILLFYLFDARRHDLRAKRTYVAVAGLLAVPAILIVAWNSPLVSTMSVWGREPFGGLWSELLSVLTDSQLSEQGYGDTIAEWGLAIGIVLGVLFALRCHQCRWLLPAFGVATALFVLSAVVTLPGYSLLAPWYFDPVRLGAIVPLIAAPLVALGMGGIAEVASAAVRSRLQWITGGVLVALLGVTTHGFGYQQGFEMVRLNYEFKNEDGLNGLISAEEVALQHRLKSKLPKNAKVVGDPRTGAALLYGIAGIDVYFPHLDGTWGSWALKIGREFDTIMESDNMCRLMKQRGIDYFYTDKLTYWPENETAKSFTGLLAAKRLVRNFELVDSGGGAALYRLSVCDGVTP